jgi:putative NIF3 family GTP cyclohydrolase 1 type 2
MRLNSWLQPSRNAEDWDNIGLLIGSEKEKHEKTINRILLCNDLTPSVVDEAITDNTDMIIAYHPPIFKPLKSIAYTNWKVMKQYLILTYSTKLTRTISGACGGKVLGK